jgi:pimeloyl-ACP methyl ester carboxylesterase
MTVSRFNTTVARVMTNGVELAYSRSGEGEPLVLIMGLGADGTAWERHVAAWQRSFACYAVDNRGAGGSDHPAGPYSTAAMADDYAGLITELGLGRVAVVGISMGGAIAQELALRHPELVSRLVLVSSWAAVDGFAEDAFRQLSDARGVLSDEAFARMLQLMIWAPPYYSANRQELAAGRSDAPATSVDSFRAQAAACIAHDTRDRLEALGVPVLVTAGDADAFIPVGLQAELAELIPQAGLRVFEGAGHAHHWERLDEFNDAIEEWLREH